MNQKLMMQFHFLRYQIDRTHYYHPLPLHRHRHQMMLRLRLLLCHRYFPERAK